MRAATATTAQASGDKATLKVMAQEAGYRSKYMDEDVIFNMTRFALDTDGPEASHLTLYETATLSSVSLLCTFVFDERSAYGVIHGEASAVLCSA
jgi:hypothetical protein